MNLWTTNLPIMEAKYSDFHKILELNFTSEFGSDFGGYRNIVYVNEFGEILILASGTNHNTHTVTFIPKFLGSAEGAISLIKNLVLATGARFNWVV